MSENLLDQIKFDVESNKILIYMKGTPEAPQCGFSARTVELFRELGYPFATRDVLADSELRVKLPQFSKWPTFPQVFLNGKLVGGCVVVVEMHERGELDPGIREALG